jgi:hypothetical protein
MKPLRFNRGRFRLRSTALRALLALAGLLLLASTALAAGTPNIEWYVIGGGWGYAENAPLSLDGTVGQAVAGLDTAGSAELCAGFWCGAEAAAATSYNIYLPLVLRSF